MKKRITILGVIILWLGGCWFIGQQRSTKGLSEKTQESISFENNEDLEGTKQENSANGQPTETMNLSDNIIFEGKKETADNPWNMTAGKFEMEEEGTCILLTPNTAVLFDEINNADTFSFSCEIHPWVRESSDGAGILIWVMDSEDTILYQEEIAVSAEEEWKEVELDISQYDGAEKIKMLCNNGGNGDDSGDWVVVKVQETEMIRDSSNEYSLKNIEADKKEQEENFVLFSAYAMPTYGGLSKDSVNLQVGGESSVVDRGRCMGLY